ncbi:hypothetical protein SAMN02745945_00465 [Peptoclostridium litorale DSM 5388]|uniref:Uncharacterized protein n=1 Tax=Peptoclostridium litorale DSM 5388 TaxID=1121324 RepID=A0A069RDM8_PEPLI|nr:hypothetical protein [Peptoclostridium litorale]KDR95164.1 hypothetical protein CLIT_11c01930 [Peptoclostridium litorale DSM 5388]SIN73989.1 hypothetical protein SAMN02745945_00465 [Peptoclostridium litorale DSM 5388]
MNEVVDTSKDEKNKKRKLIFIAIPAALLMVVLVTFFILYTFNPKIKNYANELFKKVPVVSGLMEKNKDKKESQGQTQQEVEEQKRTLAKYYVSLDMDRTVDKLMLLKNQDKNFYREMIQLMREVDSNYTQGIIQEIGMKEMKKDTFKSEIENMNMEKIEEKSELAKNYSKLGIYETVKNMEDKIMALEIDSEYAAGVLELLKSAYCARVLYYMDFEIADAIKSHLNQDFLKDVEREMLSYQNFLNKMKGKASEYDGKDYKEAQKQLSNEEAYSREEVANIMLFLDPMQAGKILSEFEDEDYKNEVIKELAELKKLNEQDNMQDIYVMINIMSEYRDRVLELTKTYKTMKPKQVADIANQMTSSNQIYKEYIVGTEKVKITEEELLIDILDNLEPKFLSKMFVELGISKSAELTRKMGLPNQEV